MSDFKKISDISVKDTELRSGISTLRSGIVSQTIKPLSITKNGTYTADVTQGAYGYSPITVNVQEEPWQPLQDGYNNIWVTFTDNTLSPTLNLSGRTENAIVDWGDGTEEETITTDYPTHIYSSDGDYIIKIKNVDSFSSIFYGDSKTMYNTTVKNVEMINTVANNIFKKFINLRNCCITANGVTSIGNQGFQNCYSLKSITMPNTVTSIGSNAFNNCFSLLSVNIPNGVTSIGSSVFSYCYSLSSVTIPNTVTSISGSAFGYCHSLPTITIPSGITSIGSSAFSDCYSLSSITIPNSITSIDNAAFGECFNLSEIHILATTPPTLGTYDVFSNLPDNFIIYVPVGYGETYKAASGWSAYADHILEEGQTPTRAMLSKFENTKKSDGNNEEMR